MKTKQALYAVALSTAALSLNALSVFAGGFPGNPEHDAIDESMGTSIVAAAGDGWKDVNVERGAFVGAPADNAAGGALVYSKDEILQARMDYRDSPN